MSPRLLRRRGLGWLGPGLSLLWRLGPRLRRRGRDWPGLAWTPESGLTQSRIGRTGGSWSRRAGRRG
ncbi:MAG: hypothetical protein LBL55_10535, partial [Propionibacteriaceae bacterium]|nr:hypothetical protein [Propionibacteriaceae bacterium]